MPDPTMPDERRSSTGIRRDINGLVRGKDGNISGSKIGTYVAQYIAAKILLTYTPPASLPSWDVLAVLFLVLIAPEAYKQLMAMKWGGAGSGNTYRRVEEHKDSTVTTEGKTKPQEGT